MTKIESNFGEEDSETLADREARLRAILETSVEGIITIDERGNIESMNPSAERLFGYSEAETVGHNVKMLMPTPYRDEHDGYLSKYRDTGKKKIIGIGRDVIGQRKDGTTFPMHLSVSEVPLSTGRIFTGFVHDLSERVATEQDLRRLATIVRDSNDAITLQQFDGTILEWNHAAERMYGYSADEAVGMNILSIVREACQHQSKVFREKLSRGERIVSLETQKVTKDGKTIDVWLTATVLHDPEGRPIAIATTERDMTEKKRIQEKLVQSERLMAIGEAMAGLAHESRNALQRSQACLDLLTDQLQGQPESLELLESIQRSQDDLHRLYEEVRAFAAPIQIRPQLCNVGEVLHRAWEDVKTVHGHRNVRFSECVECDDLQCEVDAFAIGQVFRNILENALQACVDPVEVHIGYGEVDGFGSPAISISLRDNGPGILPENAQQVFGSFFTTKPNGTGLGMAIAQRITEAHRGKIAVNPECNQGAEFVVTLPRKQS